jgi:prophage regulatory protein
MSNTTQATPSIQVLRLKQVCQLTGLGRSMIYQLENKQRFPARVRLTEHAVGWIESEVQNWLAMRIATCRASKGDNPDTVARRTQRAHASRCVSAT